jgi:hypothetical protein
VTETKKPGSVPKAKERRSKNMTLLEEKTALKFRKSVLVAGAYLLVLAGPSTAFQEPDNTKTNQQGGATAEQQAENQTDRDLAKKIRIT